MNTNTMDPVVFIYDRCASRDQRTRRQLDMRLTACHDYVDRMRWVLAGQGWIDRGPDALRTTRPQLTAMLEAMQAVAGQRKVLCLLHDWGRLATDTTHRLIFQQRIVENGGWTATTFGESDRWARAVLVGRHP
ncbi:recombinase family protein [Streptomyces sp. NPDC048595]|uniref:recombinase family protein n=1 Tax=Streptomyces sp. NPDC048595 TaxID=3365576 RepID=UPI00371B1569